LDFLKFIGYFSGNQPAGANSTFAVVIFLIKDILNAQSQAKFIIKSLGGFCIHRENGRIFIPEKIFVVESVFIVYPHFSGIFCQDAETCKPGCKVYPAGNQMVGNIGQVFAVQIGIYCGIIYLVIFIFG